MKLETTTFVVAVWSTTSTSRVSQAVLGLGRSKFNHEDDGKIKILWLFVLHLPPEEREESYWRKGGEKEWIVLVFVLSWNIEQI